MTGASVSFLVCAAALGALVPAPGLRASPLAAQEPIRCAPCTQERLDECPPVEASCKEVLREPGCGCCMACALGRGETCGIYTAPCGSGLRCLPRPGEPRPLHALTRGQAVCTDPAEYEQEQSQRAPDLPELDTEPASTLYVSPHGKPLDPRLMSAQESMKSKVNAFRRKLVEQGPCHVELQRALEKIAKSQQKLEDKLTRFYLPNCDKHGLYKPKQCESTLDGQRGKCWCVSPWNGKKILGSSELPTDSECPQEFNH
ncbi:insulin-like growth factor-binding protein 1a [Astyanax mexicanus]|uniref:Insulin-like growth factor-binding protein 1 n=1 Tax=Astyanax mexicanus TaxID=7994 RepID=A0A8B9JNF2_ASTMX|nr:insulin-like growth factor-binding protein 1a [Astyanax mexicanus]KAG9282676.1 insulin-like growth factor-binding protein 1 [Astyanax mexicanus]